MTLHELTAMMSQILRDGIREDILDHSARSALKLTGADFAAALIIHDSNTPDTLEVVSLYSREDAISSRINSDFQVGSICPNIFLERQKLENLICDQSQAIISTTIHNSAFRQEPLGFIIAESLETDRFDEEKTIALTLLAECVGASLRSSDQAAEISNLRRRLENMEELAIVGLIYGEDIHLTNNKLGAARQFARNIQRSARTLEDAREYAGRIEANVSAVLNLSTEIRNTVSIPQPKLIDLRELLRDTWAIVNRSEKIYMTTRFEAKDHRVVGLKKQLGQVFRVVMKNAVQAMEGTGILRIVTTDHPGEEKYFVQIAISDTGRGMSPSEIKKLFSSAKRTSRTRRGLGIGLAWCRLFLTIYGGKISAKSSLEEGTDITIVLPRDFRDTADQLLASKERLLP